MRQLVSRPKESAEVETLPKGLTALVLPVLPVRLTPLLLPPAL